MWGGRWRFPKIHIGGVHDQNTTPALTYHLGAVYGFYKFYNISKKENMFFYSFLSRGKVLRVTTL